MMKDSEWGAATYLSASKFGAGAGNVAANTNDTVPNNYDGPGIGITGYGQTGAYNTVNGQSASTTGNTTGIYDMAGGAQEYIMGNYGPSNGKYGGFPELPKPPYVDIYPSAVFTGDKRTNNNFCSFTTCGGRALYETRTIKTIAADDPYFRSWQDSESAFVNKDAPWFMRGAMYLSFAPSLFSTEVSDGAQSSQYGFRVVLLAN